VVKKPTEKEYNQETKTLKPNQNRFKNIFQEEMMKELEEQKKQMEEMQTEIVEVEDTDTQKEGV
jgi:hypothetical protein